MGKKKQKKTKTLEKTYITDGFGNWWDKHCPTCGERMQVVRPGKVQCPRCS